MVQEHPAGNGIIFINHVLENGINVNGLQGRGHDFTAKARLDHVVAQRYINRGNLYRKRIHWPYVTQDVHVFHRDVRPTFDRKGCVHLTAYEAGTLFASPLIERGGKEILVFGHGIGVRGRADIALNVEDDITLNTGYILYSVTVHGSEEKDVGRGGVVNG